MAEQTHHMRGITSFTSGQERKRAVSTNVEEVTISPRTVEHRISEAGSDDEPQLVSSNNPAVIRYARQVAEARTAHLFRLFRSRKPTEQPRRRWFVCPECDHVGGRYDNEGSWRECQLCLGRGICVVEDE